VLKNAIDSVFASYALRNKPLASIGYSGGIAGGVRAIEHLAHIAIEADMAPLRSTVVIPYVRDAFGADGNPINPATEAALRILLDDLSWWAGALGTARAAGQLAPAQVRMRQAMAAGDSETGSRRP
jgi:NAD(P)H-dependent FMN reductase